MFSVAFPVLESVSDIGALVVPAVTLPKVTEAGVSDATGAAGVVPVPVRVEVCGEPVASSATCSVAAKLLADAGVNVTKIEQLAPAASVAPQAFAPVERAKSLGLAPAIVIPAMFRVALPVLESVSDIGALVVPEVTLPKGTEAGVSAATGAAAATPVPFTLKLTVWMGSVPLLVAVRLTVSS
jgi:hypothetical protein